MKNVQITAVRKEFKNGTSGWEVKAEGMQGKLECKMNFHDGLGSLKAMRYMYLLSKRLELHINEIQLAAVLLDYRRSKATASEEAENTEVQHTEAESDSDESDTANVEVDKSEEPLSPMMKQFLDLKKKHPDALLLFRCGDFYETYEQDAEDAANILGITLTRRSDNHQRMAGFPYHALDTYLPKLVRAGKRVAICDQIEDPRDKKAAKRGITELIKPATNESKEGA